jgi:hypothetical protein
MNIISLAINAVVYWILGTIIGCVIALAFMIYWITLDKAPFWANPNKKEAVIDPGPFVPTGGPKDQKNPVDNRP